MQADTPCEYSREAFPHGGPVCRCLQPRLAGSPQAQPVEQVRPATCGLPGASGAVWPQRQPR
ncbi:hypothetical protein J0687_27565, partial [Vibrio alginolyticus]